MSFEYRFCVVVDNEWNRVNYPDMIGLVYAANRAPAYVGVAVVERHCWTGGDSPLPGYGAAVDRRGGLRWRVIAGNAQTGVDGKRRRRAICERVFSSIRSLLFREYVRESGGLDLWHFPGGVLPSGEAFEGTTPLERARLFWERAHLDSWRTCERWWSGGGGA